LYSEFRAEISPPNLKQSDGRAYLLIFLYPPDCRQKWSRVFGALVRVKLKDTRPRVVADDIQIELAADDLRPINFDHQNRCELAGGSAASRFGFFITQSPLPR
jgi:hypothetical protein